MSRFKYITENAIEKGMIEGLEYYIVPAPFDNALNGYAVFPTKPVREESYWGILSYVPVHGGITFAEEDGLKMMYGFDTVHYNSHEFPRTDHNWIREQIIIMIRGIRKAAEVEGEYLKSFENEEKAKFAQQVQEISPGTDLNFGTMINLLSGKL